MNKSFSILVMIGLLLASPAEAAVIQDVVTVGTGSGAPSTTVDVPVFIRDVAATPLGIDQPPGSRIQSYSIKVNFSPAASVQSVTFTRAGITASLTPTFETSPSAAGTISLIDTFQESTNLIPFTLNGAPPGNQIAVLHFTIAPSATPGTITLTLDPVLTQLTNEAGTTQENSPSASLTLVNGLISVTAAADLLVTKTGPSTVVAGTDATYTITIMNNGPSDAVSASVVDALPAGMTFVSRVQGSGPAFTCSDPAVGANGTISCSAATLVAGQSASFTVVAHVAANIANGSTLLNTATGSSSTTDSSPGNNTSTVSTSVTTSADLSVTKTASAPLAFGGQNITYTIVVGNAGPSTATSVVVTDVLPAGSTLVSTNPSSACAGTSTVTCSIATLNNGASATFTIIITAPTAGGSLTNTATVSAATSDPNSSNNTATAILALQPASAIPTLSMTMLMLLAVSLAMIAALELR